MKRKQAHMGTVEPRYIDLNHPIEGSGVIIDDALAFIYGAIKKYGAYKELLPELKEYIRARIEEVGK